jgi:GT2 family glycosyltransferase
MDLLASIVIPTRARPAYLEVALASIAPQATRVGAELLVVDDGGPSSATRALAERFGARYEPHDRPRGLNVARNTGVECSKGELLVFVDDDVRACEGWLEGLLGAAREHPQTDVFAGRILATLEGPAPRSCGRESPPITALDLGPRDVPTRFAWGSNMALRRTALEEIGPFDVTLENGGDEQEWQERLRNARPAAGALYIAGATVEHRRTGKDASLRSLCRAARVRGAAARNFDARRGQAPSTAHELLTLLGCAAHVLRRRCPAGLVMVDHSLGRLRQGARERGTTPTPLAHHMTTTDDHGEDFLSGSSGTVGGLDSWRRHAIDELAVAGELLSGRRRRLEQAARKEPALQRVLALSIQRPQHRKLSDAIEAELLGSRHEVELHTNEPGIAGKFENLNRLLAESPADGHDWLLIVDDDITLPSGFLDRALFLCERFSLTLAQPAHRLDSHAAWEVTRRHPASVVRETSFVEIGPVTLMARKAFPVLLPFPALQMGWGLDLHWAALAREHGWRCGVLDALGVGHRAAPAAADYRRAAAVEEARGFLAGRPHLNAREAEQTLTTHRRW